jgi:type I restriction enzyme S subunit
VKSAKARLEKIPGILKKFRQSVLAAACSGRLTEDWREGKGLPEWEEVQLCNLGGIKLGKMLDKAKNQGKPTYYLRNINVRWGNFNLDDLYKMNATEDDIPKFSIKNGDLFICEGGEPGRCAIWESGQNQLIFQKAIHRVRLIKNVLPEWIMYNLKNDAESGHLEEYFTGTTIKHFTLESVKSYRLMLPPFPEQREIVLRAQNLFSLADSMESKYKKAISRVEKIEQSVLAKAFRGELVEPDPNDLPATELLKQILAEKQKLEDQKRNKKRKK